MRIPTEKVVIVTAEDATAESVSKALDGYDNVTVTTRCHELDELEPVLDGQPNVVLIDIDPMPDVMLLELMPRIAKHAGINFIILSSGWDEKLVLEAMEVGARHFMRKASIADELVHVMRRLAITGEISPRALGNIITVFFAGGGCGATTLAVNLANELHIANNKRLLLIDLDLAYGAIGTYLDISGKYGLADVMANRSAIDGDLILSSAAPYDAGMNVLLSPASVNFAYSREIDFSRLDELVEVCRQSHDFTIIDAPRVSPELTNALAAASTAVFIVFQQSVKDVRIAHKLYEMLLHNGIDDARIFPVANRHSKKWMSVNVDEIHQTLGSRNIQVISNDFHNAQRSIDLGEPLAKTAPMSALRKEIKKLLDIIPLTADSRQEGYHELK